MGTSSHPFGFTVKKLPNGCDGDYGSYYSLGALCDERIDKLAYTIRVLLESAIRNCDGFQITKENAQNIIDWEKSFLEKVEIPFKPAHCDPSGVPVLVDLASMRDAMLKLGGDPARINPMVPADIVIGHSVTADVARSTNAVQANMELEFGRNRE